MSISSITHAVIKELIQRDEHGLQKYGTTLDRKDLTPQQWLQHAKEEAMDLACYLERIKDAMHDVENPTSNSIEVRRDAHGAKNVFLNGIRLTHVIAITQRIAVNDMVRVTVEFDVASIKGMDT